ncbi:MAG: hypothetical protein QOJ79_1529 [Actinomycetota bacterium]|jgi:hypothetical protein|nr:hypothetical protein [Actinomycetota bacterium]
MRARALLVATALAAVVPALPSRAATCPLIVDTRGDATPVAYGRPTPADQAVGASTTDILAADAWTADSQLHAVIRLAQLPAPTTERGYGHDWAVRLSAEGGAMTLHALERNGVYAYNTLWDSPVDRDASDASPTVTLQHTTGWRDLKTGEIRMSIPLSVLARYTKVGTGTRWMPSAASYVLIGTPAEHGIITPGGMANPSDSAVGKRAVTVGRPQCAR